MWYKLRLLTKHLVHIHLWKNDDGYILNLPTLILGVHADAWGPWAIDFYRACCNQAVPSWTIISSYTYYYRKVESGCCIDLVNDTRVSSC